jgi:CBS domain containing-hemolysin-like protein
MFTVFSTAWKDAAALPRDRKTLRNFGLVVGSVLLLLALYLMWTGDWSAGTGAMISGTIGSLLVLLGGLFPRSLSPIYPVWMALALVLGTIMTAVLLTLVFYLVVTPIGLLMRLAGKDPMNRKPDAALATYWTEREPASNDVKRMEKYY